MKESNLKVYPKLIFRETFRDEATVRKNGGTPTDVSFENGNGEFNGSSSKINYNLGLNGTYSVRIRCKNFISRLADFFIDFRNGDGGGTGFIAVGSVGQLNVSSGTTYVNGAQTIDTPNGTVEIIITGMTIDSVKTYLASRYNNIEYLLSDIDLFEIYQGTLTPQQVSNLYHNTWNRELSLSNCLLDFKANGVIEDKVGNELTLTDVTTLRQGALFNGLTSKIDTGSDFIGTKAVTIMMWIKAYSLGEFNVGQIINNGSFYLFFDTFGGNIVIQTFSEARSGIVSLNKFQFISMTMSSSGIMNFYIGDKYNAPTLSGAANQDSGTPVAGTTNVIIGNNNGQTRTFDGIIQSLAIYEGILDLPTIEQHRTSTLKQIK